MNDPFNQPPVPRNKIEQGKVTMGLATRQEWRDYKKMRLEAIQTDPYAFDQTPETVTKQELREDNTWRRDLSDPKQFILLSRYDSKPIGITKGVDRGGKVWGVHSVYVNPEFRKGATEISISTDMIKKVLAEIKSRGGRKARLWVRADRGNAIHLYEECGFVKVDDKQALELAKGDAGFLKGWQIMELDFPKEDSK